LKRKRKEVGNIQVLPRLKVPNIMADIGSRDLGVSAAEVGVAVDEGLSAIPLAHTALLYL
jgi:hypothetical protein